MNDLATLVTEDRRLAVLSILSSSAGYEASDALIRMMAERLGHRAALNAIQADLAWLRDAGLIGLRQTADIHIATLTARGADVAAGRTHVPGVARVVPGRA